jgi:hypothetical protein
MAFQTYTAKLTPLDLPPGSVIRFEAISTTTGNAISGVTVSGVTIYGLPVAGVSVDGEVQLGPFMLVPGPGA